MIERGPAHEVEPKLVEAVGVLIIDNGHVLAVRNKAGTGLGEGVYGIPGGKKRQINPESDLQAAIRELEEETGLKTYEEHLVEFPGNYFEAELPVNGYTKKVSWRVFMCSQYEGEVEAKSVDEVSTEWVPLDRLHFYHTGPNVLQVIHNGYEFLNQENY